MTASCILRKTACSCLLNGCMLQVVALLLRSAGKTGEAALPEEDEMEYSLKLNKELPSDIRVLAWCTVPAGFSARSASLLPCQQAKLHTWNSIQHVINSPLAQTMVALPLVTFSCVWMCCKYVLSVSCKYVLFMSCRYVLSVSCRCVLSVSCLQPSC